MFESKENGGIRQIATAPVGRHIPESPKISVILPKSHFLNKVVISAKTIFSFPDKNNSRKGKNLGKLQKKGGE